MAGPAPKTKDWTARENAHKPKGLHVIVHGIVQVNNTNQEPRLTESPERHPRHLGLALKIEKTAGPGLDVLCWKDAFFHKEVKANEYDSVTVRWNISSIAQFPVVDDREHGQHLAAMTASANAKYGKKPAAKKAAKKAAPKKAAKKKASKAKAKKSAKKAAKKTTKKSALKKFVRRLVKKLTPAKKKKGKKR